MLARRLASLWRNLARRTQVESDLDEELRGTLDLLAEEKVRAGMEPDAARRAARIELGGLATLKDHVRDAHAGAGLEALWRDVRHGWRSMKRAPGFACLVILTLGVGIGATATVFSILDTLLLQPLPYPDSERLALVFESKPSQGIERNRFSLREYEEFGASLESFDRTAIFRVDGATLTGEAPAERVGVIRASSSLFPLVGAAPAVGRLLDAGDDSAAAPTLAVLSYALWQRRMGGDPAAVGKSIVLNGDPVLVIGVLSPDFPDVAARQWMGGADVFLNLSLSHQFPERGLHTIVARRADSVTWELARSELETYAAVVTERRGADDIRLQLIPLRDELSGSARPAVLAMFGATGILLLLTCANVATLLLSRASDQEQEMAVRSALGVGRGRALRSAAVEHLLIAAFGAAVAVGMVALVQGALMALVPDVGTIADRLNQGGLAPSLSGLRINLRALAFVGSLALVSSFLFGLAPAIRAAGADPARLLKGQGTLPYSLPVGSWRPAARDILTIGQVALAFILLATAGLLVRSYQSANEIDTGFARENLLTLYVNPAGERYSRQAAVASYYDQVLEQVARVPGVETAAVIDGLPLAGGVGFVRVVPQPGSFEGRPVAYVTSPTSLVRRVSRDYFDTMGISLVTGRLFDGSDRSDTRRVLVVDQRLAARLWPGADPVGRPLFEVFGDRCAQGCDIGEVVGVVEPVRYESPESDPLPTIYDLVSQTGDGGHGVYVVARTLSDPLAVSQVVQRAIQSVDATQPVIDIQTMEARLAGTLVVRRLPALALQAFALVALTLALAGLHGTVAYGASRARHAMAIRVALGASRSDVRGMILRRALVLIGSGLAIGCAGALVVSQFLRPVLYGVTPTDPVTFVVLSLLMIGTCALAAIGPAHRVAVIDPVRHL